jgi:hypothetical protein
MKDMKDYNYNIFENVSKERFIEEVNSKHNNSIYYLLGSILSFNYIREKGKRRIIDVNNYEEEIIFFNSFEIFKKFENEIIMIEENFESYINNKNIKQITFQIKLKRKFYKKINIGAFKVYVDEILKNRRKEEVLKIKRRRSNEISDILIEKFKNPLIEKLKKQLDESFNFFDFDNHLETTFEITFRKFERLTKENLLTDYDLDGEVFNNFTLEIYGKTGDFFCFQDFRNKGLLIDDFVKIQIEYFDIINTVAEYFGYKVQIVKLWIFIFKKI